MTKEGKGTTQKSGASERHDIVNSLVQMPQNHSQQRQNKNCNLVPKMLVV